MQEKHIDLIKLWQVLKTNQKRIWQVSFVTTLIAVIYCIFATPIFTAHVIINPPKLTDAGNNIGQALGDMSDFRFSGGFMLQKTDIDVAIALLRTDGLKSIVIKQFNLGKYYGKKDAELTRMALDGAVTFIPDMKSGFLEIDVSDKDPKLAANMANYYVEALGKIISNIAYAKSITRQDFYSRQLVITKKQLTDVQEQLKNFALKYGLASGQQLNIAAGLITQLQAQLVVAKSQLQAMSYYATNNNPDYKTLQATVTGLTKQLNDISGQNSNANLDQLPVPSNLAPELASQYTNLERNELMYEEILKILFRQYQTAEIEGYSQLMPTTIQVIDPAIVPLHKSKPKRLYIIIQGFILGLFGSALYFIFKERVDFIVNYKKV